jgi:type IV secretory pathway VirJ component
LLDGARLRDNLSAPSLNARPRSDPGPIKSGPRQGTVIAKLPAMALLRRALALMTLTIAVSDSRYCAAEAAPLTDQPGIEGLPVVEIPATGPSGSLLAVILSGDGGWAAGDKQMAAALAEKGIPVVGFDSPSYLAVQRTPDGAAGDLGRLLEHYLSAWHKQRVLLIGYSHGADLAPFMVSRLNPDLRNRISLLALLGLEDHASFQFHLVDIVTEFRHAGDLPVLPEVEKLRGMAILCVRGSDESKSLCPQLDPSLARVETHAGGHRIVRNEGSDVVDLILSATRGWGS